MGEDGSRREALAAPSRSKADPRLDDREDAPDRLAGEADRPAARLGPVARTAGRTPTEIASLSRR